MTAGRREVYGVHRSTWLSFAQVPSLNSALDGHGVAASQVQIDLSNCADAYSGYDTAAVICGKSSGAA